MAYSNVIYTGNGATTDWAVPFPYLDPAHVAVTVNGVATAFSWVGDATVSVTPAPANGVEVRISRSTNRQARLANYADAQVLTEAAMDADAQQLMYVAQEAFDAVADAPAGGDMRRSFNLSDVFDTQAALANIGAVRKAGDTMTGPLGLWGAPVAPNEAANKAYVDALLSDFVGTGVTSFNTRSGAITLSAADVTSAIGFTPVNRAGDTLLGPLILAADPSAALGAATKQYVDNRIGTTASTGEYVFGLADPAKAAAILRKGVTASTFDHAGSADLQIVRSGGVPMIAFLHSYQVTVPGGTTTGDIGMSSQIIGTGGPFSALWSVAYGPRTNPGVAWQIVGANVTAGERVADQGFKIDRTGNPSISLIVAPAAPTNVGDGPPLGYNTSFGVAFTAATPGSSAQRIWTPLFFELDCTVPNGVQALHRGGSAAANAPAAAIVVRDYFKSGIDFRNATFDGTSDNTAIWLTQGQAIHLGANSRMYVDPSGNLTFFDPVAGSKTLNTLGGGAGTNILPLNNVWTGYNKFNGALAEASITGDPPSPVVKISRTAPAAGAVQVQAGFLCTTITQASTAGFEWNALFRLENYATAGENVGLYAKATKYSTGATWAGVFEARSADVSGNNLYGLEVDLCSDGLDPNQGQQGIAVFYGAYTNTFGAGATTKQTNGLLIWPFMFGRNTLQNGVHVGGYCDQVFNADASGLSAFHAGGAYSEAILNLSNVTNSPIAISMAGGSRMFFSSGVGQGGNQTWFPGGFVPNYVGAIEVLVDGSKRYIPIALNHP